MTTTVAIASSEINFSTSDFVKRITAQTREYVETVTWFYHFKNLSEKSEVAALMSDLGWDNTTANRNYSIGKALEALSAENLELLDIDTIKVIAQPKYKEIREILQTKRLTTSEVRSILKEYNALKKKNKEPEKAVSWTGVYPNRKLKVILPDCDTTTAFDHNCSKFGLTFVVEQCNNYIEEIKNNTKVKEKEPKSELDVIAKLKNNTVVSNAVEIETDDLFESKLAELEYQQLFLEELNAEFMDDC